MKTFDEQLNDHLAAFAAGTLEPFASQYATAKSSVRPWRHVIDCRIGEVIIYLTDEEIAERLVDNPDRIAEKAPRPKVLTMDAIEGLLKKAGVTDADIEAAKS